jgi:hypothetical protein
MIDVFPGQLNAGFQGLVGFRLVLLQALLEGQQNFQVPFKIGQSRAPKLGLASCLRDPLADDLASEDRVLGLPSYNDRDGRIPLLEGHHFFDLHFVVGLLIAGLEENFRAGSRFGGEVLAAAMLIASKCGLKHSATVLK